MVDNDSKKGHNTLLCTVGAFTIILPYNLGGKHVFLGGNIPWSPPPPPPDKTLWVLAGQIQKRGGEACGLYIFKVRHQCCVCMTCNTPTPGHPNAANDA